METKKITIQFNEFGIKVIGELKRFWGSKTYSKAIESTILAFQGAIDDMERLEKQSRSQAEYIVYLEGRISNLLGGHTDDSYVK